MPAHADRKSTGEWSRQDKAEFRELVAAGKVRCRCHGKTLVAHGGQRRWRCPVKQAADARYYASENGKTTRARYAKRRYKSPGYLAARARYYSNASGAYGRWCELRRERQEYAARLRGEFRLKQSEKRAESDATHRGQLSDLAAAVCARFGVRSVSEISSAEVDTFCQEWLAACVAKLERTA